MKNQILTSLLFIATALALIGHGGGSIPEYWLETDDEEVVFNAVGSCTLLGTITASREGMSEYITLSGDLGVFQENARTDKNIASGFSFYGDPEEDYWAINCYASPSRREGEFLLACNADSSVQGVDSVPWCEGLLRVRTEDCDYRKCAPDSVNIVCNENEFMTFNDACCPVCLPKNELEGTEYIEPSVLPEVTPPCDPDQCNVVCGQGEELIMDDDDEDCCPQCVIQSAECLSARDAFFTDVQTQVAQHRACTEDTDCAIYPFGSNCGLSCPYVMTGAAFVELQNWIQASVAEACALCQFADYHQPDCAGVNGRPYCDNGTCALEFY